MTQSGFDSWSALLARDADMRTLDDWAKGERYWQCTDGECQLFEHVDSGCTQAFTGSTPDEARAKAAAWVREQVKP